MRLALVLLALLCSPAAAQETPPDSPPAQDAPAQDTPAQDIPARLGLIPLDSRPATSSLPARIGAVGGFEVLTPPDEVLGDATRAADPAALLEWLEAADPPALVASLDALVYGGLVQSRNSRLTADEAWARLEGLRSWRARTGRPLWAFITIPRHPDAVDRPRNLDLIRRAIGWAADGTVAELAVTWDDALPGSPAPAEGAAIRAEVEAQNLTNVLVYPGADEVAAAMVSRYVLRSRDVRPAVAVAYSRPEGRTDVIRYDGLPLEESVALQARAAGLTVAEADTGFTLYVHNGGDARASAVRLLGLARKGPVALADVERVNVPSARLVDDLVTAGGFLDLYAFAGWGTPGNNLGTALAQGAMRALAGPSPAAAALLVREYVNDYLYGAVVRPEVRQSWAERDLAAPEASAWLVERLRSVLRPASSPAYRASLRGADFPWDRSFEVRLEVELTPRSGLTCTRVGPCLDP